MQAIRLAHIFTQVVDIPLRYAGTCSRFEDFFFVFFVCDVWISILSSPLTVMDLATSDGFICILSTE
jgi:hypothetical protein